MIETMEFNQYIITSRKTGKMTNIFKTKEDAKKFILENDGFELTVSEKTIQINLLDYLLRKKKPINHEKLLMKNQWLPSLL